MEETMDSVSAVVQDLDPTSTIILSHADHDGFTSSVLFNLYFNEKYSCRADIAYPSPDRRYHEIFSDMIRVQPKCLLILDALVSRYKKLLEKLAETTIIVNMDHHDVLEISHRNYINLNPHSWGLEYLNSSGLSWMLLRNIDKSFFDERCWLAAVGAVQDYCIEDNQALFNECFKRKIVTSSSLEQLLDSRLMRIAKSINAAIRNGGPEHVYDLIFKSGLENSLDVIEANGFLKQSYNKYLIRLNQLYKTFEEKKITTTDLTFFDLRGESISYISDICERERNGKIYVGYSEGLLAFRSLFFDYDVRELAKPFGGGGAHPKVAGARTKKSFRKVVSQVSENLRAAREQTTLNDFI